MGDVKEPGFNILLAEDDPEVRLILKRLFEKAGCFVETAENGYEAVRASEKRYFNAVFLDYSMPEMDGIAAAKKIRGGRVNPLTPIVILSGMADFIDPKEEGAADHYLTKPVRLGDIKSILEALKR